MVIAILMAGGKGTRLKSPVEKPLFKFKGQPLIDHVLDNLINSKRVKKIAIATSPHTPKTTEYIANKCDGKVVECIETPGQGYLDDLSFLLNFFQKKSDKDVLLFINTDLPFITSDIIDFVICEYFNSNEDAMSVMVPLSIFKKYGIGPSYVFNDLVPSGLNILISQNIIQNEKILVVPKVELALNINTVDNLKIANEIFK